jgi:hypothetical protein
MRTDRGRARPARAEAPPCYSSRFGSRAKRSLRRLLWALTGRPRLRARRGYADDRGDLFDGTGLATRRYPPRASRGARAGVRPRAPSPGRGRAQTACPARLEFSITERRSRGIMTCVSGGESVLRHPGRRGGWRGFASRSAVSTRGGHRARLINRQTARPRVSVPIGCQNSGEKREPETDAGAAKAPMWSICRDKAIGPDDQGLLAMQKVEGSSPFSRFEERRAATAFRCLPARSTDPAGRHFLLAGCQLVAKTPRPKAVRRPRQACIR